MNRYERHLREKGLDVRLPGKMMLIRDLKIGERFTFDKVHHPTAAPGSYRVIRVPSMPGERYILDGNGIAIGDEHVVLV